MLLLPVMLAGFLCIIISFGLENYNRIAVRVIGVLIIAVTGAMLMQKFINARPGVIRSSDTGKVIEEPQISHFGGIPMDKFKDK